METRDKAKTRHTIVETQPRSRLEKQCLATAIENRDKTCLETLSLAYLRSWRIAAKCLKEGSSWSVLLNPVYTIQPVVKRVWQPAVSCKQTSKQLSNRLSNRLWQPVWQPCWTNSHCSFNGLSNRVVQPVWQPAVYTIQPFCQTGCQTGLTSGWMFVYTIQPVVNGCIVYTSIYGFDNRFYRVNGALGLSKRISNSY